MDIQPGEGRLVTLLLLLYFFIGITNTFVQTTAFSLFLTVFDSQKLSLSYIPMAVILMLLTFSYLKMSQRLSFSRLLSLNIGALLVIVVSFGIGLVFFKSTWVIFALPILFQIVVIFGNLAFWSLAGRIFNVRQGKRLFGLVGAGEWVAIVILGFTMPIFVRLFGLPNLLWLAAAGVAGSFVIMRVIVRQFGTRLAEPETPNTRAEPGINNAAPTRGILKNRYVLLIFILTLAWWLVFFFLDNIFYGRAAIQYPAGEDLAGFLGIYLAILGILTLISNFLLTGPIIKRFGLRSSLLIMPVGLVIGTLCMASAGLLGAPLVFLFWTTLVTKIWNMNWGFSLEQSAHTILYQPLPTDLRTRVQTVNDGVVQPLATGLAGVSLLAINAIFGAGSPGLVLGLLVVVCILLFAAFLIGREFAPALLQALTKRRLSSVDLVASDATSLILLRQGLQSPHPGVVIYSAHMLENVEPSALEAVLPDLVNHEAQEVRRQALESIERLGLTSMLSVVNGRMPAETSSSVKGAALRCLARLGAQVVLAYLDDPMPAIQTGAIAGLLNHSISEAFQAASAKLLELANSANANDRVLAAQILGEIRTAPTESQLQMNYQLMRDADLQVRRAAIRSAGLLKSPLVWPGLIDALRKPGTRAAASSALISGGEAVLPFIAQVMKLEGANRFELLQLTMICGRIGGKPAIELLKPQINAQDVELRTATLRSLNQSGFRAASQQVQEWIKNEISYAAWVSTACVDLGRNPASDLLLAALNNNLVQCRDRILALLSFLGDSQAISRARENLMHAAPEKKAYALEVIDIQTPTALRRLTLPLMEELSPEQRLHHWSGSFPQKVMEPVGRLQEMIRNSDDRINAWTQACALYVIGQTEPGNLHEIIQSQMEASDNLVRETAAWLQRRAKSKDGVREMLSTIEKVIILKTVGLFSETSDEILAEVAVVCTETQAVAGATIFEKGDAGDSLYLIASGSVRVMDGTNFISELHTGDVFGEMAVLDPKPRSASIHATEDTHLLKLDQQALFELIDERPEVARGLLMILSQRVRNLMGSLAESRNGQPEHNPT